MNNNRSATTIVCWLRRRDDAGFPDELMLQSVTVTSVHYGGPEWPNKTCAAAVKLRNSTLFYLLMQMGKIKSTKMANWFEKTSVELVHPLQINANTFSVASTAGFKMMLWSLFSSHHLHLNLKMFSRPEWIWRCRCLKLIPRWQNWTCCS